MKTAARRLLVILGLALILMLAFSNGAYAITGNFEPDAGRHPYVGLLVFDIAPGVPAWRCTGSLIAPNVVLCAGHCTDGAVAARFWPLEDVTYDAVPFPLYPYGGPGSGAVEGTPYLNPDYGSIDSKGNGITTFSYRDVGIVVLDEPIIVSEYAELPTAGLVDTLAPLTAVDLVGYGVQYQAMIPGNELPTPPPYYRWTGPRCRYYAPAQLLSGKFSWSDEFVRITANPARGKGGTAFGDSGGPVLLGDTSTVLAVNSYLTNINCGGVTYSSRIDIPDVLEWINSFCLCDQGICQRALCQNPLFSLLK
jgi:hypothetical protein